MKRKGQEVGKKNAQTMYKMGIKITRYIVGGYVAIQPESKKREGKGSRLTNEHIGQRS